MTNTTDTRTGEEAALWFLRLNEATGEARATLERAFEAWLLADPAHADAYANVAAAWDAIGEHDGAPEMVTARRDALSDAHNAARARWRSPSHPVRLAASIVVALAVAAIAALVLFDFGGATTYATEVGERRAVTLADNSRVSVDADSEIAVAFTPEMRLVRLARGQAFFEVEKDAGRPFVVEAAGRRVVALGTAFNVELVGDDLRVTLVEGRVVVREANVTGAPAAELAPGEQLTATGAAPARVERPSNVAAATSWRQGKLVFDDEPLGSAIARMQRYSRLRVAFADPALAEIRVSGVFNTGDMNAFVGAIETYFPVTVVRDGSDTLRLVPKG